MIFRRPLAALLGLALVASIAAGASAAQLTVVGLGEAKTKTVGSEFNPAPGTMSIQDFLALGSGGQSFNNDIVYFDDTNKQTNGTINGLALTGGAALVRFTYLGKEAGNRNFFDLMSNFDAQNGNLTYSDYMFDTNRGANPSVTLQFGGANGLSLGPGGLLPFAFLTNGTYTNNAGGIADNSGELDGSGTDSMKLGFSAQMFENPFGHDSILVFLGDGLGDADFDDMVIGVGVISAIPLPAPVLLLLSGLFGLGLMSRLRRRSDAA